MAKSATDVMQEIIFSAVLDSIVALKASSKGMPNTLLRDINAIHGNVTFADLPSDVQASITVNVRAAFTRLQKEGYSVSSGQPLPPRIPVPRHDAAGPGQRDRRPPRRDGPGPAGPKLGNGAKPGTGPKPGGRPPRKPKVDS